MTLACDADKNTIMAFKNGNILANLSLKKATVKALEAEAKRTQRTKSGTANLLLEEALAARKASPPKE